jgi:hypothetical protein
MLTFRLIVAAVAALFSIPPTRMSEAEVDACLANRAAEYKNQTGETLNWKESIVDLLKLLGCSHDLFARRHLARDLGYGGPVDGSAEMNVWLIGEVRRRFAAGEIG